VIAEQKKTNRNPLTAKYSINSCLLRGNKTYVLVASSGEPREEILRSPLIIWDLSPVLKPDLCFAHWEILLAFHNTSKNLAPRLCKTPPPN